MLYSKYAETKFELLNKHKVFFTKEQIEEAVRQPDETAKKNAYNTARKENIKVIYKQHGSLKKIITFFPVK